MRTEQQAGANQNNNITISITNYILLCLFFSFAVHAYASDLRISIDNYAKCKDDAYSTAEMEQCNDNALRDWEIELNDNYRKLLDDPTKSAQQRTSLKQIQRLWLKYREANCKFYASIYSEGTLSPIMYGNCMAKMTKDRADELSSLVGP